MRAVVIKEARQVDLQGEFVPSLPVVPGNNLCERWNAIGGNGLMMLELAKRTGAASADVAGMIGKDRTRA